MATDIPTGGVCDVFRDDLAQLALGTLSGKERADVIDHVEGCAECAAELEGLSVAADALLLLAPVATPSNGFDQRAISAMTGGRDRRRVSHRVLAAAAAVALALGVGIGAIVTRSSGHDATFASVTLTSASGARGDVILSWGSEAWMFMTLDEVEAKGPVTCTITLDNGKRVVVGHFHVDHGYGAWAVWLKNPASQIRSVAVLDRAGVTLASAKIGV